MCNGQQLQYEALSCDEKQNEINNSAMSLYGSRWWWWWWYIAVVTLICEECEALIQRSEFLHQSLLAITVSNSITTSSQFIAVEKDDLLCRNGALIPEQAVPGAYSNSCMTLPRRIVPLQVPTKKSDTPSTISTETINLIISQEASGSGRTGLAVWNSGLLLTRVMQSLALQLPYWFAQQKRILELGCGTGVVSIACHQLGAPNVLATDGNPDVVRLANQNIEINRRPISISGKAFDDAQANNSSFIEAKPLQWGLLNAMDYSEAADLVLGSDLTYNAGTWRALAETMEAVLSPTGTVLYLSSGHEGFNVNSEIEGFLSVAKEMGLVPVLEIGGEVGEKAIPVSGMISSIISSQDEIKQLQLSGGAKIIALQRKQVRRNS